MAVHRGRDAVALLSGQARAGEANVVCPTCRSDHTRVFHVGTRVGTNDPEAVSPPAGAAPTGATPPRHSVVEIVFSCEHCPHHFAVVIEQHQRTHLVVVYEEVPNFTD
jgi:hypothetical protein